MTQKNISEALVAVRIVHIDYYEHPLQNYSSSTVFQAARITSKPPSDRLPVIRIFGSTPAGQRACVHVHGLRPYLYFPLPQIEPSVLLSYTHELRAAIESALRAAYTPEGEPKPFIADVKPVLKHDIYGYRASAIPFVQIFVYAPSTVLRIATIIAQKALPEHLIAHNPLPYDAHVPFVLQFLSDFSLAGMDYIYLSHARFRGSLPTAPKKIDVLDQYQSPLDKRLFYDGLQNTQSNLFWPFQVPKRSTCALEMDTMSSRIMNAEKQDHDIYDFTSRTLAVLWEEERLRIGKYPIRKRPPERPVKAGAQFTDDFMKESLKALLHTELDASQGVSRKASDIQLEKGIVRDDDCNDSQEFNDVLKYLDAPSTAETNEDDIIQFLDDTDFNDWGEAPDAFDRDHHPDVEEQDAQEEHQSIKQTWADIAACTQTASLSINDQKVEVDEQQLSSQRTLTANLQNFVPRETNSETQSLPVASLQGSEGLQDSLSTDPKDRQVTETGKKVGAAIEIKTPWKPSSAIIPGDDDHDIASFEDKSDEGDPSPQCAEDTRHVSQNDQGMLDDAFSALDPSASQLPLVRLSKTSKPHDKGEKYHVLRPMMKPPRILETSHSPSEPFFIKYKTPFYGHSEDQPKDDVVYGGRRIPVRRAGAKGYLPFPQFIHKDIARPLEVLPRVVCPIQKPPKTSDLRKMLVYGYGDPKETDEHMGLDIDSAGRQIVKQQANTTWRQFTGSPHSHMRHASGNADKAELARALNTTEGISSLHESLIGEHGSHSVTSQLNDQRDALEFNRPPSPKYDEAYQFVINSHTAKSFFERKSSPSSLQFLLYSCADSALWFQNTNQLIFLCVKAGGYGARTTPSIPIPGSKLDSAKRNRTATASQSPHMYQNLTVMAVEVLASSYGDKLPDPARNGILAVSTYIQTNDVFPQMRTNDSLILVVERPGRLDPSHSIHCCDSEDSLLDALASLIRARDPDAIVGFETQNASIGYILERAQAISHGFLHTASRWLKETAFIPRNQDQKPDNPAAAYYRRKGADIKITGRHIVNLWRIARKEVKLPDYSKETIAAKLFGMTFPKHANKHLEEWFNCNSQFCRAMAHLSRLVFLDIAIIDKLNVMSRTGELARVFGIDFMSVLTRGSQYRVESMMRRVAGTRNFVLLTAPREEVFRQPAVEALPLVMEPLSALYVDPVIVLDFQSLYPSVIIAHNLCFSTMMGNINRISTWFERRRIGVQPNYDPPMLEEIPESPTESVFVASNGEMFVQSSVRKGILPQLLEEILETRIMVKTAMKEAKDEAIVNLLNARQFGLKMIANVTYGYTSASFSGRMPCAGLADTIVQCGRDCLENVIQYVEGELRQTTGATVVYGDTDSLFVQVPGVTREEAFRIGKMIVGYVEKHFPIPITLKLEKVYHPCIMQTKKRYVGYSYESPKQAVPVFDAKGIETVRRDSCPLVQKAMEKCIRTLFETKDVSLVKTYIQRLCQRLHQDRIPHADYIFRKEVRLGSYKEGHLPPAAIIATKAIELDPRAVPRHGERVPFVVVYERPGAPLKDCVVDPEIFETSFHQGYVRLNTTYYITKQLLPALNRIFGLIGARVSVWYAEMPRPSFEWIHPLEKEKRKLRDKQSNLKMFYGTQKCIICHKKASGKKICYNCIEDENGLQASRFIVETRRREIERKHAALVRKCISCIGVQPLGRREVLCTNILCPVHEEVAVSERKLGQLEMLLNDELSWTTKR